VCAMTQADKGRSLAGGVNEALTKFDLLEGPPAAQIAQGNAGVQHGLSFLREGGRKGASPVRLPLGRSK